MKTIFKSGGFIIAILLLLALTAHTTKKEIEHEPVLQTNYPGWDRFQGVPMQAFREDVSRYFTTHFKIIDETMPRISDATQQRGRQLNLADQIVPSRMFIYTLEDLKKFIRLIDQYGDQLNIPRKERAMRFYYGVYPKDMKLGAHNYGSLHTLFMVPNAWDSEARDFVDIDYQKSAVKFYKQNKNFKKPLYSMLDIAAYDPGAKVFMLDASAFTYDPVELGDVRRGAGPLSVTPAEPPVINQGQLCPPNCPPQSLLKIASDPVGY